MAHSREPRAVTQVRQAHPQLDDKTADRVGAAMSGVAQAYGTDVRTVVAESVQAEASSAAGIDAAP